MTPVVPFRDRSEGGQALGKQLRVYAEKPDVRILALPRGGVPVGFEIARALHAPLDVFLVRKIGLPAHPELALGAIASGGVKVWNESVLQRYSVAASEIEEVIQRESAELLRREALYRDDRPAVDVRGKVVVLVDDGLATGASMRAAVVALNAKRPARLIVAVPVGAPDTCEEVAREVDELVCPLQPPRFEAVGLWYDHFPATTDEEVRALLEEAQASVSAARPSAAGPYG